MFIRVKRAGEYEYLQLVENRREGKRTRQRIVATLGRLDRLHAKGQVDVLLRSLGRFAERVEVQAHTPMASWKPCPPDGSDRRSCSAGCGGNSRSIAS